MQYILGKDHTSPVKVEVDAPQQHYDAIGTWRKITYTYDDGCQIILQGEDHGDPNAAECIVAKNRHGEIGTVKMHWDGQFTRFTSVDPFR